MCNLKLSSDTQREIGELSDHYGQEPSEVVKVAVMALGLLHRQQKVDWSRAELVVEQD